MKVTRLQQFLAASRFDNVKLTHLDRAILTHPKLIVE
jgi:hypothetical protein